MNKGEMFGKITKRGLAWLLLTVMLGTMLPTAAFAEGLSLDDDLSGHGSSAPISATVIPAEPAPEEAVDLPAPEKVEETFEPVLTDGGSYGDLSWELYQITKDEEYKLIVSGEGEMNKNSTTAPWNAYAEKITALEIGAGITEINSQTILLMKNLRIIEVNAANRFYTSRFNVIYANYFFDYVDDERVFTLIENDDDMLVWFPEWRENYLVAYPGGRRVKDYEIPVSVDRINKYAFGANMYLTELKFAMDEDASSRVLYVESPENTDERPEPLNKMFGGSYYVDNDQVVYHLFIDEKNDSYTALISFVPEGAVPQEMLDEYIEVTGYDTDGMPEEEVPAKFTPGDALSEMTDDEDHVSCSMHVNEPVAVAAAPARKMMKAARGAMLLDTGDDDGSTGTPTKGDWSLDIYYVDAKDADSSDNCLVHKNSLNLDQINESFNVKYQVEFHTNDRVETNGFELRIPAKLFIDRAGLGISPKDIAVPQAADKDNPVHSDNISFNYYIETIDGVEYLVFFNYEPLPSGTNAAFQVLYKNMKYVDVVDESSWTLQPTATVNGYPAELNSLRGSVNTEISLDSTAKVGHKISGKSYGPGLYSESQIKSFLTYPTSNAGEINTTDYVYTVWKLTFSGRATTMYDMYLQDIPTNGGEVVGFSKNFREIAATEGQTEDDFANEKFTKTTYQFAQDSTSIRYNNEVFVVVRYPITGDNAIALGEQVDNTLEVHMHEKDTHKVLSKESKDHWTYVVYDWYYQPGPTILNKTPDEKNYNSWINAYQAAASNPELTELGGPSFNVRTYVPYYDWTHYALSKAREKELKDAIEAAIDPAEKAALEAELEAEKTNMGTPKAGHSYIVTTGDDLVYAAMDGTPAMSEDNLLDYKDYYLSSVSFTITDTDYDPWEDKYVYPDTDVIGYTNVWVMNEASPNEWTLYVTIPNTSFADNPKATNKIMSYSIPAADLKAQHIYRVCVEHETMGYSTNCDLSVSLAMRTDTDSKFKTMTNAAQNKVYLLNLASRNILLKNGDTVTPTYMTGYSGQVYWTQASSPDLNAWNMTKSMYGPDAGPMSGADVFKYYYASGYGNDVQTTDEPAHWRVPWREQGIASFERLTKHAEASKTGAVSNDSVHSQVNQRWNLTSIEGYNLYSQEAYNLLSHAEDVTKPDATRVKFYDLLPFGVIYDPSAPFYYGRIKNLENDDYKSYPQAWDKSGITYTIKAEPNYNDTGRTMVEITLDCSALGDPSVYSAKKNASPMWFEGFGVSFGSYYSWDNAKDAENATNEFAYSHDNMMSPDLITEIIGTPGADGGLAKDDGTKFAGFKADLNHNNRTDDYLLFGSGKATDTFAMAGQSELIKKVRNNQDSYNSYSDHAEVNVSNYDPMEDGAKPETGSEYTYELTVKTASGTLKDIVVYDVLEQAAGNGMRSLTEPMAFDDNWWKGTFNGLELTNLVNRGIDPVVYYWFGDTDADPKACLPATGNDTDKEFTPDANANIEALLFKNGWHKSTEMPTDKTLADVTAVAVDMRKLKQEDADGNKDFKLEGIDSISFEVKMIAPRNDTRNDYSRNHNTSASATHAYNNASYYGSMGGDARKNPRLTCDATVLTLQTTQKLEITKDFDGEIPEAQQNKSFEFVVTQSYDKTEFPIDPASGLPDPSKAPVTTNVTEPFANKAYTLYTKDETGAYVADTSVVHTTDADGKLTLKAGQKAYFQNMSTAPVYNVEETPDVYWYAVKDAKMYNSDNTELNMSNGVKPTNVDRETYAFSNSYRAVVYAQKKTDMAANAPADEEFTFRFMVADAANNNELKPYANREYWIVDYANTNGITPTKLNTETLMTDENGMFKLKANQIAALFPDHSGVEYSLEEVVTDAQANDWVIVGTNGTKDKDPLPTVPDKGAAETVTNRYLWRELYISKEVTNKEGTDTTALPFAYRIQTADEDGNATGVVSGNSWVALDKDGKTVPAIAGFSSIELDGGSIVGGNLDENGMLIAPAGYKVRVEHLKAEQTFIVSEPVYAENNTCALIELGADGLYTVKKDGDKFMPSMYRPLISAKTVKMDLKLRDKSVSFSNDWILRPISVTKLVVADSAAAIAAGNAREFTMTIKVADENGTLAAYADKEFALVENGQPVAGEHKTNENGEFKIKNGQTVTFKDVAIAGTAYKITETPDTEVEGIVFNQLLPAGGQPASGVIAVNGSEETFINGTSGLIMFGKQYSADTTTGAQAYLDKIRTLNEDGTSSDIRTKESVTLTVEFKKNGQWVNFPQDEDAGKVTVTCIDLLKNNDTPQTVDFTAWTDGTITVEPFKQYILSIGEEYRDEYTDYRVSESDSDREKVYNIDSLLMKDAEHKLITGYLRIEADTPEISGNASTMPVATIVNKITHFTPASIVRKAMYGVQSPISENDLLVMQVEVCNNGVWSPAEGVEYIRSVYNGKAGATDNYQQLGGVVETTGSDGRINLRKAADVDGKTLYPELIFPNKLVHTAINGNTTAANGTYRIVEILEESDGSWGRWQSAVDPSADNNNIGVITNSTRTVKYKIAKAIPEDTDDGNVPYTYTLEQIKTANGVTVDDLGKNMPYTYYYANGEVEEYNTDSKGQFKISAGDYIVIELPDGTDWKASEQQNNVFQLKPLAEGGIETAGTASTKAETPNTAYFGVEAEKVPIYLTAKEKDGNKYQLYDITDPTKLLNQFVVELHWSNGEVTTLSPIPAETPADTSTYYNRTDSTADDGTKTFHFASSKYPELTADVVLLKRPTEPLKVQPYAYTGKVQTYIVPEDGTYFIQVWGAKGGNDSSAGGNGGYAEGYAFLTVGTELYVYVGGQGGSGAGNAPGGWNGGANSGVTPGSGAGGGATDVRTVKASQTDDTQWNSTGYKASDYLSYWDKPEIFSTDKSLLSRIIVAGAGGGGGNGRTGGVGGGLIGGTGNAGGKGGTQSAETSYAFGVGQMRHGISGSSYVNGDGGSGGGGWYGGWAPNSSAHATGTGDMGGGGGSSYIGGVTGGRTFAGNEKMPAPGTLTDPVPGTTQTGQAGNGFCVISFMG